MQAGLFRFDCGCKCGRRVVVGHRIPHYLKPSSVALLTERFAQLCSVLGLELCVWFYSMLSVLRPLRIPAYRPTPTPNRMLCVRRDLGRLLQVIMLCQRAAWPHFPCGARQGEQSV